MEQNPENNVKQDLLTFLLNSIGDIQGTIRAIDVKLNVIVIFLVIPITKLNEIYAHIKQLLAIYGNSFFSWLFVVLFALLWACAFISTIRGLIAIDNPSRHIKDSKMQGIFFAGNLFHFSLLDSFFNRHIVSSMDVEEMLKALPYNRKELLKELIYEQMKLSYIRGIKITRQKYAYFFLFCWLLFGGIIWILSL